MSITFVGTKRFKVLRKLGEGGMGAVYECQDVETASRIALKTLLFASASTLLRFKDEFRQFQGIHHPNLVSLGELFEEDGMWHFTMELVRGRDFTSFVRQRAPQWSAAAPDARTMEARTALADAATITYQKDAVGMVKGWGGIHFDDAGLRSSLGQLGKALAALHAVGKVHRDVKPNNILVTSEGRTVLLDFGIAIDASRREQLASDEIVGTPHYMAPEQAAGLPVSGAADWYAVGVLLFEALTGSLPFEGTILQVIEDKQHRQPVHPRDLAPGVPEDLAALALELLATDAKHRPSGEEVLQRLGVHESTHPSPLPASVTRSDTQSTPFVGREKELACVHAALGRVALDGEASAVYVHGESGIGKSAVVRRFADDVRTADPSAVVLAGACYEHEAVPYKAVDGVVDALSRYLARLPSATVAALLPRHGPALAQAFPVLGRVEAFADCPPPRGNVDPVEQRSRVFGALRELLARLADRSPLVVCIDDLQWADADSIALLGDILRPPDSPALLFVATVRTNEGEQTVALPIGPTALPPGGILLRIESLPETHSRELVDSLTRRVGRDSIIDVEEIVREAHGYPLFLNELVRYHATRPASSSSQPIGLDDALWSRIDALEEGAKRLLHVTALAPAAIMQGTAMRAAGIDTATAIRHIKHLKVAHLVRTSGGTRTTDLIEPHHGRVREAVRARLPADTRRALHRRLALTMETSGIHEHEQLAIHWREAGEPARAAEAARHAAARADEALAFDRAATYYRMVDELGTFEPKERRALLVRLGDALANGGRSQEAAEVFREAAAGAGPLEARELARRAAEHLLRSGHIKEGLAELRRVLATVEIGYPETTGAAVTSMLWSRAKLALRGLGFRPVEEAEVGISLLAQIDACWAATTGLFVVDQLRGVDFQYRHLLLALGAGEPTRIVRGLAFHSVAVAAGGQKAMPEAQQILTLGNRHAAQYGTPYSHALLTFTAGTVAYLAGRFTESITLGQSAIEMLRSDCRGVAWELASARQNVFWSLAFTGRLDELARLTRTNLRETLEAGDHYAAMGIRSGLPNVVWLAQDDPAAARQEANDAIAAWSDERAFLQHLMDLVAQTGADLYEGYNVRAFERVERSRKLLEAAGLTRVEFNRILVNDVCSRAALGAARSASSQDRKGYLDVAKRDSAQLARERAPWARALALGNQAAIACLEGRPESQELAARATDALLAADLGMYAACCAHAAGLDRPDARALLTAGNVKRPDHFARVFAPGW